MNTTISILSEKNCNVHLADDGEIPFGPHLFSLHINHKKHNLQKKIFLEKTVLSKDCRYVLLTEYIKQAKQYYTQLIMLDLVEMKYATVQQFDGLIIPLAVDDALVVYQKEKNSIIGEYELSMEKVKHWQALADVPDLRELEYKEIFQHYGYELTVLSDGFRVRTRFTRTTLMSLCFVGLVALVFLIGAVGFASADEIFQFVALVVAFFLLGIFTYAFLIRYFLYLYVAPGVIKKYFFTSREFAQAEVESYVIKSESILKPRSAQIESYTWYLLIKLRKGDVHRLIHFNSSQKQKGQDDVYKVIELFKAFVNAEVVRNI